MGRSAQGTLAELRLDVPPKRLADTITQRTLAEYFTKLAHSTSGGSIFLNTLPVAAASSFKLQLSLACPAWARLVTTSGNSRSLGVAEQPFDTTAQTKKLGFGADAMLKLLKYIAQKVFVHTGRKGGHNGAARAAAQRLLELAEGR